MNKLLAATSTCVLMATTSFAGTNPVILQAPDAENNAAARAYFECVVNSEEFVHRPDVAREQCRPERDYLAASVSPVHREAVVKRMDGIIDMRWRRES